MRSWSGKGEYGTCVSDSDEILAPNGWFSKVTELGIQVGVIRSLNPLTPKISLVILLTVCNTVLVILVLRIWYWINY